ncbi:beta-ketoacyl-[acyl-carrier-protein] synthase family protein [Mariniblastus fucicola]|uniref:3-oxoacyl-[acyl-carrier-protein] synthase 2 n=1 Tax=Mariniblastus fucicola TaxID=980251 RepID=A0A5B9PGB8_9BACT|nr:beta-ketoacyl-[acyl-carrier-protein] synthase family protein [Mariniblastus fucicola]QEG21803.1 3-oxoacyl-[acyl-carrier-protein] synthase 2 [Mariniblastus fucicola]
MNSTGDVVVSGMGVVSPIGVGIDSFWQNLLDGVSGIRVRESFAETDMPLRIGAPIADFDPKPFVKPRKALKIMCQPIQFGCAAANLAFEDAGFEKQSLESVVSPDRIGTLFGTETFFADPAEVARVFRSCTEDDNYQHDRWGEFAMRQIQPLWMLKYLPNMAASHISIAIDARGPSNSICQGEASGLLALIEAADLIKRGVVDVVIAGGTGSQMALTAMLYRGIGDLSRRINEPEKASRPFDAERDGMVIGEGSGVVVLESAEHAAKRGATPVARLAGWSRGFSDPNRVERNEAFVASIKAVLADSGMTPDQIGLVSANAHGSIEGDASEAQAIQSVLGDVPVVAHKSNFGNLGPGTSVVELIGSLMALKHRKIPPTLNYENPDPDCPVNVSNEVRSMDKSAMLKTGCSGTGQMVSVVFEGM